VGESLEDEARQSRVVERFLADLETQNGSTSGSVN
jgi:F-type H+-transporting ATPase subunit b